MNGNNRTTGRVVWLVRQARDAVKQRLAMTVSREAEAGAATAEYAITIMAAVGFAGLLVVILRSEEVRGVLTELVRNALAIG